jgi:hypothetical protein
MKTLRYATIALSLIALPLAAAPAFAQQDQSQPEQGPPDRPHHGGPFQSLSPQQRMMMFVEMHQATANMTDDQRHAYHQSERQRFMAMNDGDRLHYAAKLQADWDALPLDQKAQIKQQMHEFRQERMQQHQDQQGGGMSPDGQGAPNGEGGPNGPNGQ